MSWTKGLFIHEPSLIFGLPLLAALWWIGSDERPIRPSQARRAAGMLALSVGLYLGLAYFPRADVQQMVDAWYARSFHRTSTSTGPSISR